MNYALDPDVKKTAGRTAGRFMRALAAGAEGGREQAIAYAEAQNWVDKSDVVNVLKAAVGGLELQPGVYSDDVSVDFIATLRPLSLVGRLDRARRVPIRTKVVAFGTGTRAYVVGERKPIPLSMQVLEAAVQVVPTKVAAISVATKEFVEGMPRGAEIALTADLAAAVGAEEDLMFLDPGYTGSILDGASTAVSAGTTLANVDTDLAAAVNLLIAGDATLSNAVWMMSTTAATKLSLLRGTGGAPAFPDIGPQGGMLLKMPVVTSEAISGYLALVDEAGILLSQEESAEITLSQNTTLQMTNTPVAYPGAPSTLVSIFQAEAVAFKAVLRRGWYARAGAAAYITGGNFA